MYEIKGVRQYSGEPVRRWFYGHEMDLAVWFSDDHSIVAFQLCYDKTADQHAVTWRKAEGYRHHRVDDGESPDSIGRFKGVPMLMTNGRFDGKRVAEDFAANCREIPSQITDFVYTRLLSC